MPCVENEMPRIHLRNQAAALILGEDDFECVQVPQTCNVLIPDTIPGLVVEIESQVAGRELHLNAAQFDYVRKVIFGEDAPNIPPTSGRWIFTRCSNSQYWMEMLAMRLEEPDWDGYDIALALRCYEHAVWCADRYEWAIDANDCCSQAFFYGFLDPIAEVHRLEDELEFAGLTFADDTYDFRPLRQNRART